MNTSLLVLLSLAGVPEVTAGPELAEKATVIDAPIARVTVYSDRARVQRRAAVPLAAGIHALRLPDLPGAVLLDTVRVGCPGATVLRVEATPIERERTSIEQVEGLLAKLEEVSDRLAGLDAQLRVHGQELALLALLAPQPPVPEQERVGQPPPPLHPEVFARVLDFLQQQSAKVRERLGELARQRRSLAEQLELLQREVERQDLGGFSDRRLQVVALLETNKAGQVQLELEYFIPGASWRPSYDLHYRSEEGLVTLQTSGRVQQTTGEGWNGVELLLSTAIPGQGIEIPELLTWALGERKEFVPRPRPAQAPVEAERFAPPAARNTPGEQEAAARRALLQQRLEELQRLVERDAQQPSELPGWEEANRPGGPAAFDLPRPAGAASLALPSQPPPPPQSVRAPAAHRPAPARPMAPVAAAPEPMPFPQEALMMGEGEGELEEEAAASAAMAREDRPRDKRKRALQAGRAGDSVQSAETTLRLFQPGHLAPPPPTDPTLPAVLAGGLDYVYTCPTRATIPSTGEKLTVPLGVESHPVEAFYVATPALKDVAFLRAEVTNRGEQPILGGPVNIFVGTDFAGQGELQTTGPGGVLRLPLGADEDIRLKRTVIPSSDTEGFLQKEDVTTYTTTIEVGNYKKRPIRIAVIDQLPRSGHEEIHVKREKTIPPPLKGPDEEGVMRWELGLAPGQTQKIVFVYHIRRPQNWQLHQ